MREPLDKIDVTHRTFDAWEIILYIMALSFTIEGKSHLPLYFHLTNTHFRHVQGTPTPHLLGHRSHFLLQLFKLFHFVAWWRALSFWNIIALITDALLIIAFILRVVGMQTANEDGGAYWRLYSFQVLSCVAPFIWMSECVLLPSIVFVDRRLIIGYRTYYGF